MSTLKKDMMLSIHEVEFDRDNPRIKGALEKYGNQINAERIHFALQSSSDGGAKNESSFHQLKISIKAGGRISEPIKVVKSDEGLVCIDGNTRLAIYRDFANGENGGEWQKIPALVLENASQAEINEIRLTAHILGPRPWPAFEKAKYLAHLRYERFMDYETIIALCGGDKSNIERQIDAFEDMCKLYKDKVKDTEFRIDRFSGFVELQKPVIKSAILEAGFELSDFGKWIHEGKIYSLQDVRRLPKVLRDEEAREKFVRGGLNSIKDAIKVADQNSSDPNASIPALNKADIKSLARTFREKLESLTQMDLDVLEDDEEFVALLEQLSDRLDRTIHYVRKS